MNIPTPYKYSRDVVEIYEKNAKLERTLIVLYLQN
jgi:hypothetical protein